jgi:transcriptional regulator with XRE-family HTH domain
MRKDNPVFATILKEKMEEKGIGPRKFALQCGVSHTTIYRLLNGEPADVDTLVKICNYLEISPASALNSSSVGKDALAAQIALVLEKEPKLQQLFEEISQKIVKGEISDDVLGDIVAYASYKLSFIKSEPKTSGHPSSQES